MNKPELPIILDSTRVVQFRACPRQFYNAQVLNRAKYEFNIHLSGGGAFAAGLEEFRLAHYVDGASPSECFDRAILAAAVSWGDNDPFPPDRSGEHLIAAKSLDRIMLAILNYFRTYDPRFDRLQPVAQIVDGRASFEYSFTVPLDKPGFPMHPSGSPFVMVGRGDTVGTYDHIPVFSDEKTTGAMGKSWANQWTLRNQFLGYTWMLRELGRKERACLVRGVCILKTETKYAESLVHFPDHLLDQYETSLMHNMNMMLYYHEHDYWPQDFGSACDSFGECPFKPVCLAPPRIQNHILFDTYYPREWDPTLRHPRPTVLDLYTGKTTQPQLESLTQ
jgi:hypothetical protein